MLIISKIAIYSSKFVCITEIVYVFKRCPLVVKCV